MSTVKCEDGKLQLYGTTYTRVGILTVCVNGIWSRVCGTTDDNIIASIVCAQLGYSPHGNIYCMCVCECLCVRVWVCVFDHACIRKYISVFVYFIIILCRYTILHFTISIAETILISTFDDAVIHFSLFH